MQARKFLQYNIFLDYIINTKFIIYYVQIKRSLLQDSFSDKLYIDEILTFIVHNIYLSFYLRDVHCPSININYIMEI